jgi:hypothetical protein
MDIHRATTISEVIEMETKEQIISILHDTQRTGMKDMVRFLQCDSDFFEAPASAQHHCAYVGGLAEHSLSVYDTLVKLNETFDVGIPAEQMSTTALLHDMCKMGHYVQENKWRKDDYGKWESYTAWGVDDKLPLGHGEKSLFLVGKFLQLTDSEAAAIRWHMGCWTPGIVSDYPSGSAFRAATDKYPLVTLLHVADYMSSQLLEE